MKILPYLSLPVAAQKAVKNQYEVFAKKEAKEMGIAWEIYNVDSYHFDSWLVGRFWIYSKVFDIRGGYYEMSSNKLSY